MKKVPNKYQQVSYCELCNRDHPKGNINASLVIKVETLQIMVRGGGKTQNHPTNKFHM